VGMNSPLHLGVTDAGDGEDGRIKSAVGIGTLLEDGLGDTVRVSLTEEPEAEAPVAIELVNRYSIRESQESRVKNQEAAIEIGDSPLTTHHSLLTTHNPYEYKKRDTYEAHAFIGGHMVPRVVIDLSKRNLKDPGIMADAGYLYSPLLDKYNMAEQSVDFVYLADELPSFTLPGNLKQLYNYNTWLKLSDKTLCHPVFTLQEYILAEDKTSALNMVKLFPEDIESEEFGALPFNNSLVFVLETNKLHGMADQRAFFFKMEELGLQIPVIVKRSYAFESEGEADLTSHISNLTSKLQLFAATDLGALLVDGFGDGIWIDVPEVDTRVITSTAFGILQATRSRISKTEYISCPSCGRTLFDLMITTQMIRSRTSHLKGLKIGIMGCIVNGPGEMADADYGYVGSGTDKITLYRGKEAVKKNISAANALDELIGIIKDDGNWVEQE
jgi:(E)-4-hydroxy-3-methylbut-2-enyl-diphosphate synthase